MTQAIRTLVAPGLRLAVIGTAIGCAAALGSGVLLRSLIWGVAAHDPLTFGAVTIALLTVSTVASVVPALRILKLDPASTLRAQ
jgi:putative ABC transport system permease protein